MPNPSQLASFIDTIWAYYHTQGRSFSWRNTTDPYHIVVSEIMLQQTQTYRVVHKYEQFLATFPTFAALAYAPFHDVLVVWQGLGYSRRAQYLQKIAHIITHEYDGQLPNDPELLATFPGIGPATAGSICAFAFNRPTVFIETNVRAVFINAFFSERTDVHDKEIYPLAAATVDQQNPRQWYYALMDYGVHLKKQLPNPSRKSTHHTKQSKFEGSDRQIRGKILKALISVQLTLSELVSACKTDENRITPLLKQLKKEQFIRQAGDCFSIFSPENSSKTPFNQKNNPHFTRIIFLVE